MRGKKPERPIEPELQRYELKEFVTAFTRKRAQDAAEKALGVLLDPNCVTRTKRFFNEEGDSNG